MAAMGWIAKDPLAIPCRGMPPMPGCGVISRRTRAACTCCFGCGGHQGAYYVHRGGDKVPKGQATPSRNEFRVLLRIPWL